MAANAAATSTVASWNAELAFRAVAEATADKAGIEFLRHLVKNLAESLGVAYAFVAEFADAADRVRTIALWDGRDWRPNIEYALAGTPCEQVVAGQLCLYRDEVQRLFPEDSDLVTLGARSYLGVPLRGAQGQTMGHLAVIDTRPMSEDPRGVTIFEVFANRARVELERLHAEAVLARACEELQVRLVETRQHRDLAYGELQALLEISQSSTRHIRREELFGTLAACVNPRLPTERSGIEVPTGPETLRVHVLAMDCPTSSAMIEEFPAAGTACRWAQENRQRYVASCRDELRKLFPTTFAVMERERMESLCALPLLREERSFGALFFMSTAHDAYRTIPVALLERVASAVAVAVDNCFAYEEVRELRDRLAAENSYLQEEITQEHDFREIVGRSPAITRVLSLVDTVARTPSTVLILGETGTGKELIARAIHDRSPRRHRPLVKVNCSAIASGLVESELFGHVKGAFTGAFERRIGRFELADGGTIFLDEVGELPLDTQVKLLRVLQEREFEPVGSNRSIHVDVRIICATNRNLQDSIREGTFRSDLYYRLNVFPLEVPPLRERRSDIPQLAMFFLSRYARNLGKRIEGISASAKERLINYSWPGNIRELQNVIERALILCNGPMLELESDLSKVSASPIIPDLTEGVTDVTRYAGHSPLKTLQEVERAHILAVLQETRWVIEGSSGAAKTLGMHPNTLRHRMEKLGVKRATHRIS